MLAEQNGDLVSVVIPAYNAALHIRETLASVLAQSHRNLDIVVVDDGSTDETAQIVKEVAAKDCRIRLIRRTNGGVARARNSGIEEARGEYIAILDADDIWHAEKIDKQLAVFHEQGAKIGLVYCWYREIDDAGRILSNVMSPPYTGNVYAALILSNFVGGGSAALIRRTCVEEIGGFDSSLRDRRAQGSEDTKFFLAIAERYDFGLVREFLMGYRRSLGSMSRDVWQMLRSKRIVLSQAQASHPELPRRLFRWAYGESNLWLATESLCGGRVGSGLALLFCTFVIDPAAVCRPSTFYALRAATRAVLRLACGAHYVRPTLQWSPRRAKRILEEPKSVSIGPLFVTVPSDWGADDLLVSTATGRRFSFARRQALAASCSVREPFANDNSGIR
jgi:glycosyltransferase involved in cell wall biosynthesis